jgi:hypothetical protein
MAARPQAVPELRCVYSIAELARMGNISVRLMRRLLRASGVSFLRSKRLLYVPVGEIRRVVPALWENICIAERVRRGVDARDEDVEDVEDIEDLEDALPP